LEINIIIFTQTHDTPLVSELPQSISSLNLFLPLGSQSPVEPSVGFNLFHPWVGSEKDIQTGKTHWKGIQGTPGILGEDHFMVEKDKTQTPLGRNCVFKSHGHV
jgi:hypothetical protein